MTVYGPRLYFGPLDTPTTASDSSSCGGATISEHPPLTPRSTVTDTLAWNRTFPGKYRADLDIDLALATGVVFWEIVSTAARRWEIISLTAGMERRRHGAAYTLREAKTIVGNFHRSNLTQKGL